ncbi:uncharacterized protein Dwil_GK28223 [Drosophila willistoni]|uniref:Uncharacterized protein n=1 Tax=Drosophila willistoni TaxID=7260 RepID=A0A0Q9X0V7_DROWI|nr:uncharacterized protein Dwil_GK28223 [Drosophila willistoni]
MKFTNYKCENVNTSIVQVHQCRLKAVKRDIVTLHFNATLLESAQKIRTEVALFKKANGYKPWLYKIDVDVCRFFRKAYNPIAIALVGDALRFSNINHSCPYEERIWRGLDISQNIEIL